MLPAPKSRVVTNVETSHVCALGLRKGHFDPLIGERRVHLLQPLVFDGRGGGGREDWSSPCSWLECVVGLSLCRT